MFSTDLRNITTDCVKEHNIAITISLLATLDLSDIIVWILEWTRVVKFKV